MIIRPETKDDIAAIRAVNELTFGRPGEAELVEKLRASGKILLSLVAIHDNEVAGHILFCPVTIESAGGSFAAVGLGPMAVTPHLQRQGMGSSLVRSGLDTLRARQHEAVVVLGHPEFYGRFGFETSRKFGVGCQYEVPEEVFMLAELQPGAMAGRGGTVVYPVEFNEV